MSENTPENPRESEPQGTDSTEPRGAEQTEPQGSESLEPQDPETPESQATKKPESPSADGRKSISAESIVNAPPTAEISEAAEPVDMTAGESDDEPLATEAGQFRTAPRNMDVPFSTGAAAQSEYAGYQAAPTAAYPTPQPTREYPQPQSADQPQLQATRQYLSTRAYPAGYSQQTSQQSGFQQAGHPQQAGPSQLVGSVPRSYPAAGQYPGPSQHPAPGQYPAPGQPPYPHQAPNSAMPMQATAPPRRVKRRPEPVAYAPVTGGMPLSRESVTEIPADGPIEYPRRRTGLVGVANLVLSAVMAVIWAWIPLGLLFTGIGGIFALGLGVLALIVWVVVQQGANVFERYRAELIYGDRIQVPKIERSSRESGFARFFHNRWLQVKSGSFWRSTAHHYVKMLIGAVIVGGTITGICLSIIAVFGAINPEGLNTFAIGNPATGLGRIGIAIGALIVLASSLAILWFAPYLDRALDRSLLPPARTAALQAEVTELDRARMAGIEAAGAERLRIERDLHDGAQPRLVALTMTLGMAKSKIDTDPERAKELVAEAHSEAKGIVSELRQLARGIHPAVLTDRGLDAAVSALAGRSRIPVDVDVRLSGRIDREAEAVSYFVVAECLTNIAKHSTATHARVFIAPTETGVQIVVTDNGQGGARIDRSGRHTGIAGLIDRVEAARGTLNLTSPAGGPTTLVVEVPCAS